MAVIGLVKVATVLLALFEVATASLPVLSNVESIDYSTNLDQPQYRLRDNVKPTYMRVNLDVYLTESRFNGDVEIEVEVSENVTQIVLHQNVVTVTDVNVVNANGVPVPLVTGNNTFEIDNYYEIIKLNFAATVVPGKYKITIKYLGRINENPLDRGFYKGYYYLGNQLRQYATTQFQPYHARKAFPCFDEPQFKCKFVISITRDESLSQSYSNMAINTRETVSRARVRETFFPTPVISAYLIAFHVSDFVATNNTSTAAKPFQIISRVGATNQHGYAADVGVKITNALDEYLDIKYYEMGQGEAMKNDHIALPDFPSGAMENWGMVNYRESYLLYDDKNTNLVDKLFIATIIAHEMAHKWFGNLVTCFWWSNLWLNESFASYFEYFAADVADPYLELSDRYIINRVQSALTADASASATPMNLSTVASNPSITNHFGVSSYAKGASVLRMLEHFVGYTTFRNALRIYLKANQYKIGYPQDMYNAFKEAVAQDPTFATLYPNIDIETVFDSWVQNPGAPVVNVDVDMHTGLITIAQERFQLTGTPPSTLWQIPITWTHGGNPNFSNLKPSFVLRSTSRTIQKEANHDWVILNLAQSGYYRVNYDDHNWEMIASQLREDKNVIHKLSRSQIVNDVLFFVRAEKITIERAFDVLSFLNNETDYYVWAGALPQLDWIRQRLEHLPVAHEEFTNYTLELLEESINYVGYEERSGDSASMIQHRMQILNLACNLGHEGCVNDSLAKWNQFKTNSNYLVPVNARRYVYCTGIREGNAADYDFLFQKYNSSENTADMVVMLRALGCAKTESLIDHYLDQALYSDKIRIHDKTSAFSFALQGNKGNLKFVLKHLYENFDNIRKWYGGEARLITNINALASYLTDFNDIVEFQTWVYSQRAALGGAFSAGESVVTSSMNNLVWGNKAASDIVTQLRRRNASSAVTASVAVILMALIVNIIN